jgi:proteic killer suppression protein
MRFVFATAELVALYVHGHRQVHPALLKALRRVVDVIAAAPDERTLHGLRGLRLEKLRGNRTGQYSVRLNDQYRLIVEIERDGEGSYLTIVEMVDYH